MLVEKDGMGVGKMLAATDAVLLVIKPASSRRNLDSADLRLLQRRAQGMTVQRCRGGDRVAGMGAKSTIGLQVTA